MTGDDTGFLIVTSSIACQLKDLSSQVFHDSSQVDWCSCSNTFSIVAFSQETMDTSNRECNPARDDRDFAFPLTFPPLPRPDMMNL